MARKVIIDCDPGIDDAIALCLALFDPRLEVVAVTAVAGNVGAQQASRNVQAILELLDPPRWPRLGTARADSENSLIQRGLHGADGLGNLGMRISELHHQHPSDKVISDEIRNAPGKVTILALGPLTNIARVIGSDPELATQIDGLIVSGGSVEPIGNITPVAEFNVYCDPQAAQHVLRSPMTKTLVPLDITSRTIFTLDFLNHLPDESSRAGRLVQQLLPFLFRTYRQQLGREDICLHDTVALQALLQPDLFETDEMAGDVEVVGELTAGMTVFDRRVRAEWRNNMEVARKVDHKEVRAAIQRGLRFAAQQTPSDEA